METDTLTSTRRLTIAIMFFIAVLCIAHPVVAAEPRLQARPEAYAFAVAPEPLPWTTIARAALWASQAADTEAAMRLLDTGVQELTKATAGMGEEDTATAVLDYMHRRFLSAYVERQTRLDTLLSTGRYNCVSSAVLYLILGTAVGLDIDGVMTVDHAFCAVRVGVERVDVETTSPYGYDPGSKKEFQDSFGRTTGFAYVPARNYRDRSRVGRMELVSLILTNLVADAEAAGRFADAVGLYVDRWALLGGGPGQAFEDLVVRLTNYGASLAKAGRDEEAIAWAERAIETFGSHRRWEDFLSSAVNNLVVRLLRAGKIAEARSRLEALRDAISRPVVLDLDQAVSDAELMAALERSEQGADPALLEAAIAAARERGVLSADRLREVAVFARLRTIESIAKTEGWAAAYAAVTAAIAEMGADRRLEDARKVFRANRVAELHNAFAGAYNKRMYSAAVDLAKAALAEFPDEARFKSNLSAAERAAAAVR